MQIGDRQKLQDLKLDTKYIGAGRSLPTDITFGALSDRGKVREKNEDHYAVIKRKFGGGPMK